MSKKIGAAAVVFGCKEDVDGVPGIPGIEDHARGLADTAVPRQLATHATDDAILRSILIRASTAPHCRSAYVISHGEHPNPTDAGVLLTDGAAGTVSRATVASLRPRADETGPTFAYFNCCELGKQSPPDNTLHTHFGGFAQGLIENGCARELICNRWPVDRELAFKIAQHFFDLCPRTTYARAAALHRARRLVQNAHNEDPTWLAPIHILAERR